MTWQQWRERILWPEIWRQADAYRSTLNPADAWLSRQPVATARSNDGWIPHHLTLKGAHLWRSHISH